MAQKKVIITFPQLLFWVNVFGMVVSAFLWSTTVTKVVRGCLTGGCETVLFSSYSKLFGVPLAAYGVAFYAAGVLFAFLRMVDERPIHRLLAWVQGVFGIFASAYFFYLELFKIHAICSWCKLSTLATIVLLALVVIEVKKFGGLQVIHKELKTMYKREI